MPRNNTPVDLGAAGADLSGKEFCFGKFAGGVPAVCDALGERSEFVIHNEPKAGDQVAGQVEKIVKVKVGAAPVALHAELTPDANGLAITAVATNIVRCIAMKAGAAGEVIEALWVSAYAKA
jgi:hypothetical protein